MVPQMYNTSKRRGTNTTLDTVNDKGNKTILFYYKETLHYTLHKCLLKDSTKWQTSSLNQVKKSHLNW